MIESNIICTPTKGHFCSLLVSNIFCDPHFLLSTLCSRITTTPKTLYSLLVRELRFVFPVFLCCKRRIFLAFPEKLCPNDQYYLGLPFIFITNLYKCVTPPCILFVRSFTYIFSFSLVTHIFGRCPLLSPGSEFHWSVPSFFLRSDRAVLFMLPLDRTFLS